MRANSILSKTTRPAVRRTGAFCLVCALAACSSGSSRPTLSSSTLPASTTTASTAPTVTAPTVTTLPSAATIAAVRAFFAHAGKPLLEFERATTILANGTAPSGATCIHLSTDVLPKITGSANALANLARTIPEPTLAGAFGQTVSIKMLLILGCSERAGQGLPPLTGPGSATEPIRRFSAELHTILLRYGITV